MEEEWKSQKVRHEGIERSLKKFKVLEVLEKKQRLANIATEHRENTWKHVNMKEEKYDIIDNNILTHCWKNYGKED